MSVRAFYDLPAPAKLNLFLHVVGRRPDGYHLLQSLFVLIDWCDTLHIESRDDGRLQRHDLGAGLPADDLCLRAARALQSASGCRAGADISIDKQIPWGSGLGGGSSDAATTLLALNRLWKLGWPRSRLLQVGLAIGADVPFFIAGENALVEGIGERLSPVDVPAQRFAVLKPPSSIETRSIFASPLLKRDREAAILTGLSGNSSVVQDLIRKGGNDLQIAAEAECSEVSEAVDLLKRRFGNGSMTGSGSAVFASVASADFAAGVGGDAQAEGQGENPGEGQGDRLAVPTGGGLGWVGRMCHGLPFHPLRDWAFG